MPVIHLRARTGFHWLGSVPPETRVSNARRRAHPMPEEPPKSRRGREGKNAGPGPEDGAAGPGPDLRSLGRRRSAPFDLRGADEQAFREALAAANRELAALLREVRHRTSGKGKDDLLVRAIRCAVRQNSLQAELGALALTDALTGLCNRRGFLALAERQLKLARRAGRWMLLFFIDMDGLKGINDSFGHLEGDLALVRTAKALQMTFRDSDIVARIGGDEFAALAIEASDYGEAVITARLEENLAALSPPDAGYSLSVSVGAARFDPDRGATIGQLLALADGAMYRRKRGPVPGEHAGGPGSP